jgi:uncharacterized membrane protein YbhN (UPF0104 family)
MAPTTVESGAQLGNDPSAGDGLSKLLTRILDQLSLSSWLPAIVLVCNSAVLMQLNSQQNLNLAGAVKSLTEKPLGILVVLVLLIIVASIVTQAFEFEVIRILEGYWGSKKLLHWLAKLRIRHHAKRFKRLEEQYSFILVSHSKPRSPGSRKPVFPVARF